MVQVGATPPADRPGVNESVSVTDCPAASPVDGPKATSELPFGEPQKVKGGAGVSPQVVPTQGAPLSGTPSTTRYIGPGMVVTPGFAIRTCCR